MTKNDILFTVGPCEMYEETLRLAGTQSPYFRTPEFSEILLETNALLKELTFAAEDTETIFLTCSGTGALEAIVMNALTVRDKALVVNGGRFGSKFAEILRCHDIPHDEIILGFNEKLTQEHLDKYNGKDYTALLVNIHETGTGQLYGMKMLSDFCVENGLYFIVDAISSFCADELNMSESRIDALIISSQKALALDPGISAVLISKRIYEEKIKNNNIKNIYFDFNDYVVNIVRGQTPYTPAVGVIITMREALQRVKKSGLDNIIGHTHSLAETFRQKVLDIGIGLPDYPLSNCVTTLVFDEKNNAQEIYRILKEEYGLTLILTGEKIGEKILRVGHIGNMKHEYYDLLVEKLSILKK